MTLGNPQIFENFLNNCLTLCSYIWDGMLGVVDFMMKPITNHLNDFETFVQGMDDLVTQGIFRVIITAVYFPMKLIEVILEAMNLENMSLAVLMLGAGLVLYLFIGFIKWVLDIWPG